MTAREALDNQMRAVLVQLAVVSNGTITSYNPSGGGDSDTGSPACGDEYPAHIFYALCYGEPFHTCEPRCRHYVTETDEGRAQLLTDAQAELASLRRGSTIKIAELDDPENFRDELLKATVGCKPEEVETSRWRTPARLVRRMRIADDRDPDTGIKRDGDADIDAPFATRARELAAGGLTERQISAILNKPKSTVRRALGKAA